MSKDKNSKTGVDNAQWFQSEVEYIEKSNYNRKCIKSAGIGLSNKRKMKYKVQDSSLDSSFEEDGKTKKCCFDCKRRLDNFWIYFTLWKNSFKNVEAVYGSGVLAFFEYLKTMFIMNAFLSVIIILLVILPQSLNFGTDQQNSMIGRLNSTHSTAGICSTQYVSHLQSYISNGSLATYAQDSLQGTGIFEEGMLFIGYYFPEQIVSSNIFNGYYMPLAYIFTFGLVYLFSVIFMLVKTGSSFKQAVLANATKSNETFCELTFCFWNYSLTDEKSVNINQKMMYNTVLSEIDDAKHHNEKKYGSRAQRNCTIIKRVLINLLIIGMLAGAGYLVYYVEQLSSSYTSLHADGSSSITFLLYSYLPAIVIALIGAVLPILFELLVKFENYRTEVALFLTILRTIVVNLISLTMVMVSIFDTLLCSTKDSCNIGSGSCTGLKCWETYVGQTFYRIAIMFFLVSLIKTFVVDFSRALIGKGCSCALAKLIGPAEFQIPKHTIEVLSMQITLWFGIIFCPFLAPINTVTLFILFYLKKFGCHFCYKPSERPFKASKATTFFMAATFVIYFLCILPVGFLVTQIPTSRSCSPFRRYSVFTGAVNETISSLSESAQKGISFLSSPGFLFFVIVMLIIIAYFYAMLAAAEKMKIEMHEKALQEEGYKKLSLDQQYRKETKKPLLGYSPDEKSLAPAALAATNVGSMPESPKTVSRTANVESPFVQGLNRV